MKRSLLLLVALAPLAAACSSVQAKTPVERPNLEVPPPPPRVIEPMIPSEPPALEPVEELPVAPVSPRSRPVPQRDTARAEPPKTDPPPVEQPPIGPPAGAPAPAPQLRTPNTPDAAQAERQVRDAINRATGLLNTIDYRVLTNERRAQYDNAKLMLKQAEDAVKTANFDFAKNLAEKAERIAKELQG